MKFTIEDCRKMAFLHKGKCLSEEYFPKKKIHWECVNLHRWYANFYSVKNGSWCRKCYFNSRRSGIETVRSVAKNKNGLFLSDNYVNSYTKYLWECEKGHQWFATLNHIKNMNSWCMECSGNKKHSLEDCCNLAREKNGKCLSTTYDNIKTKLLWECEKGHRWEAKLDSVKNGNRWCPTCKNDNMAEILKNVTLEKYGVPYISQIPEFALKAAKAQNNAVLLYHWRTDEELVCVGSYETKTVQYLNQNKINFRWQPKAFNLPDERTYRPDCYLPDQDMWVEIKGYFRKDAKEKWDWFHKTYPNSELWDKKKLKEMRIL